jgi:hypothetical protein
MEIMLRFCFLDPIVVNQPASLNLEAYFLLILEFNLLQVHGHLPFWRVEISHDDFSGVDYRGSVLDPTEHLYKVAF